MKYIFCAGAPGSKWSSLIKNIYYSPDIDRSDYSEQRTYWHDAPGTLQLMHLGAYFDPGMEFGRNFDILDQFSRDENEQEFDRPFSGTGMRVIKSHVFAHHIDHIKKTWPDSPIILALREDDACLGWWVKCGHFDITYPLYHEYYRDLRTMAGIISRQNANIRTAWNKYSGVEVTNNQQLAACLDIEQPPAEYQQDYVSSDLKVKII
jgi:hypothetical protein